MSSVLDKALDVFDVNYDTTQDMVIYGLPGAWKSSWVAVNAPKPLLFVDTEGSSRVAKLYPHEPGSIKVIRVRSIKQVNDIGWALKKEPKRFASVCIDTVTELQRLNLYDIVDERLKGNKGPGSVPDNPDGTKLAPEPQDYGESAAWIGRVLLLYKELPINTIFIIHAREDIKYGMDGSVQSRRISPAVTPALSNLLAGDMHTMVYMKSRQSGEGFDREMIVSDTGSISAKNRYGHIKPIKNPTWEKLFNER